MLELELHKLFIWADTNNMKFNASKFERIRYGGEQEIKTETTYKSHDDSSSDSKEQVIMIIIIIIKRGRQFKAERE